MRAQRAGSALAITHSGGATPIRNSIADLPGNATQRQTASPDFPTPNPFNPRSAAATRPFVTKLSAGVGARYSTYLGGGAAMKGNGIAVGLCRQRLRHRRYRSTDFPTVNTINQVRRQR